MCNWKHGPHAGSGPPENNNYKSQGFLIEAIRRKERNQEKKNIEGKNPKIWK